MPPPTPDSDGLPQRASLSVFPCDFAVTSCVSQQLEAGPDDDHDSSTVLHGTRFGHSFELCSVALGTFLRAFPRGRRQFRKSQYRVKERQSRPRRALVHQKRGRERISRPHGSPPPRPGTCLFSPQQLQTASKQLSTKIWDE